MNSHLLRVFNCSFNYAKSRYFRPFNAIRVLSKVGRFASEKVISLIYAKCLPVLL